MRTATCSRSMACAVPGCRPTGRSSKWSSFPITPGSSAASSTPSSNPAPRARTPCSRASWAPRGSNAAPGGEGGGGQSGRRTQSPPQGGRPSSPAVATEMALHFGGSEFPFLIAGPCVVESDDLNLRVGEALAELGARLGVHVIYKASYDKANRSRLKGARGPGLERGLGALAKVRGATGLPILTDVHEAGQVAAAAQVADVLQIPAFLCRQTDLLVAAGRAGRAVNVKKGQWMASEGMAGAVEKVRSGGAPEIAVTERGTFFGYGD